MQVPVWYDRVIGKGTVLIQNAQHGAPGTVPFEASFAVQTLTAAKIDFAANAFTVPVWIGGLSDEAGKFMSQHPGVIHVAMNQFEIGITDPGVPYLNQSLVSGRCRLCNVFLSNTAVEENGFHCASQTLSKTISHLCREYNKCLLSCQGICTDR